MFADRGTNYFHAMVKKTNSATSIPSILKEDDTTTTSQEEVISEFLRYYRSLLCMDIPILAISSDIIKQGISISKEDYCCLSAPIEDYAFREALFQTGDDKAYVLDGYTAAFFKVNWDIVKEDFIFAIKEFFKNGRLLKQLNHVAIALIPKAKHAPQAKYFRHISR